MNLSRSSLSLLLALPLAVLFASGAAAQTCNQCTPYSDCDESCTRCRGFTQDGCLNEIESTCGEFGGACMQCAPSYVETSRQVRGTYGNGSMFSCSHHKVESVTRHDNNQCNTNSTYWDVTTCEDTIDGGKSGWFPDCCNGYGPNGVPDSTYTCNHQHSC